MNRYNRVVVIGISGAGKSSFARELAQVLNLPVIHTDSLIWAPDWTLVDEPTLEKSLSDTISKNQWIIEGYIAPLSKERFDLADLVIDLDFSGIVCAYRALKRWWAYRGTTRPEMPEGCIEELNYSYLKVILFRRERPEIEMALKDLDRSKLITLKSPKEAREYIRKYANELSV